MFEEILSIIAPILGTLLTVLIGFIINLVKKKSEEIESDMLRKGINAALGEADSAARHAVEYVQQSFVEDIKEREGSLNTKDARIAMERAKKSFINSLSDSALDHLMNQTDNFEEWLEGQLEAKLYEEKLVKKEVEKLANPN